MKRNSIFLICIFGIFFALSSGSVEGASERKFTHPGGFFSISDINSCAKMVKGKKEPWFSAYRQLEATADQALSESPKAPKRFLVPGYYQDPEGHRKGARPLQENAFAAYSLAMAYRFCPDRKRGDAYAKKAVSLLDSWTACKSVGYSIEEKSATFLDSFAKGLNSLSDDSDLVMCYAGTGLVLAAELLADYPGWASDSRTGFRKFVKKVLMNAAGIKWRPNNWGDWGLWASLAGHYFLEEKTILGADIKLFHSKILTLAKDGHLPLEVARKERGIWYTYFSMAPKMGAAQLIRNYGRRDYFAYTTGKGRSLKKSLDYLFKYSLDPSAWPHHNEAQIELPGREDWPGNLFEAMLNHYPEMEWEKWIRPVRPIQTGIHHLLFNFPTLLKTPPKTRSASTGSSG
jgi:hypothetical protein